MNYNTQTKNTLFFILITTMYGSFQLSYSQNLVRNPSFEDVVQCPEEYGSFHSDVLFWTKPTYGSTDYFNGCSKTMTPNRNSLGKQEPFHGMAYAGLYAYGPKDYREYISGELEQKLQKNKKYIVSAMISLSEKSEYAIDEFGFLFTAKALELRTKRNIPYKLMANQGFYKYTGQLKRAYYKDKIHWIEVKCEYIADGTERYLIFGNFKENRKTRKNSTDSNLKKAAYYYVDMVSVEPLNTLFNLDEIYVFEGLNFEINGSKISDENQKKLQPLIDYLIENPSLNIAVYGHTDDVGNKDYNKELSEKRAKNLSLFLVDNGLSPIRVSWKGFGDAKPVVANKTEQGREQNRRVEFVISKKQKDFYTSGLFEDED